MQQRSLRRVGHKGADLIAPGNTVASFDAALDAGVDMIEFDVLPEQPGDPAVAKQVLEGRAPADVRLILAHDWVAARTGVPPSMEEGLDHLSSQAFAGVELDVDLKLPGYELKVLDALREYGLASRALISSQYRDSLDVLRAAAPELRLGWSVPKLRQDPFRHRLTWVPVFVVVMAWRELLPFRAARAIRSGRCTALMAHWRLITPRLVRRIQATGGELYVWTVDEQSRIRSLEAMGVTGVITNDPRLFAG
jgi:glycerophosphoryl diester phosphodiesterase